MIEKAIRERMADDATISGIVGTRLYCGAEAPQGAAFPYIVITRISSPRVHTFDGYNGLTQPRIQVDCYAETYSSVKTLADGVRNCWDGYSGTVTAGASTIEIPSVLLMNERDFIESGDEGAEDVIHRVSMDLDVYFRESAPTLA